MRKSLIRRERRMPEIPMASTADIAFLLILFFMVTTVIRTATGLKSITRPLAESTERIKIRRNIAHIWVDATGQIMIDDVLVPINYVSDRMYQKKIDNPDLITIMDVDQDLHYGFVDQVMEELKEAGAFRITFATDLLKGGR